MTLASGALFGTTQDAAMPRSPPMRELPPAGRKRRTEPTSGECSREACLSYYACVVQVLVFCLDREFHFGQSNWPERCRNLRIVQLSIRS